MTTRKKLLIITIVIAVATLAWLAIYLALSHTPEQQALHAFEKKQYDIAQQQLKKLQVDDPNNPLLSFNLGVTNYHQQQFDAAESNFSRAATQSEEYAARASTDQARSAGINLAAKSFANAGNSSYQVAQKFLQAQDREHAVETLERSAQLYRHAIDHNPNDARSQQLLKLIETLIEQLKKHEQDQKNEKNNQQNKNQQNSKDQKKQQDKNQKSQDAKDQNPQNQNQNDGEQNKQSDGAKDQSDQQKQPQGSSGADEKKEQPKSNTTKSEHDQKSQNAQQQEEQQKPLSQEQYDEAIKKLQEQLEKMQKESDPEFMEKREHEEKKPAADEQQQAQQASEENKDQVPNDDAEKQDQAPSTSAQKASASDEEGASTAQKMFMSTAPKENFEERSARLLLEQLDANESALQKRRILVNQNNGPHMKQGQKPW